jgi:hypothetical protein
MATRLLHRRGPHPSIVSAHRPAIRVLLLGAVAPMGPAVEFLAGDRYRCHPIAGEAPHVVVSEPFDVPTVSRLKAQYPGAALVVWDRREATSNAEIARARANGVDAYVTSPYVGALIANLDALGRRPPSDVCA